jgi:hypothetical protein
MTRHILLSFAALAALTFTAAAQTASDQSSEPASERMEHWASDHEAMLNAKLAGLKAGLELTSDQEKLWPPLETAIRDAAKLHMEQMRSMMERMRRMRETMRQGAPGEAVSPVDRLEALGQGLSARGAAIEKVADAAKPLYASLDDSQKRRFVLLGRALFMTGGGHPGMEMMRGERRRMGGAMDREGRDSDQMERTGQEPEDEDDNPDEE